MPPKKDNETVAVNCYTNVYTNGIREHGENTINNGWSGDRTTIKSLITVILPVNYSVWYATINVAAVTIYIAYSIVLTRIRIRANHT